MNANLISILIAAGGVAVAMCAIIISILANKIAKQGNSLAQTANATATSALGEAREANTVAKDANELAGDANSIAERALRVAQDDVPYNWVLKVDDNGSAWVVNDCGHLAGQVTVVIDCGGLVVGEGGPEDVAPFGEMVFDLKSAVEQHLAQVRLRPHRPTFTSGHVTVAATNGKPLSTVFRAHLRWVTDEQVPRTDVVEEILSHHMTYDGMKRLRPRSG